MIQIQIVIILVVTLLLFGIYVIVNNISVVWSVPECLYNLLAEHAEHLPVTVISI